MAAKRAPASTANTAAPVVHASRFRSGRTRITTRAAAAATPIGSVASQVSIASGREIRLATHNIASITAVGPAPIAKPSNATCASIIRIVPQAIPALVAVSLFHFFWAWNEYFLPLVYLQSAPDLQPLSVGLARFNALYSQEPTLVQAGAIMAMALPVVVLFLAQRAFMRGVVFTGVEK